MPCVRYDQGHGIIDGDTQVCRVVEGGSEAHHHDPDHEEGDPPGNLRRSEDPQQRLVRKVNHVTEKEHVQECDDADIVPVRDQHEQEQHDAGDHVHGSEVQRYHIVHPAHQRLERIHSEQRHAEQTYGKRADQQSAD